MILGLVVAEGIPPQLVRDVVHLGAFADDELRGSALGRRLVRRVSA